MTPLTHIKDSGEATMVDVSSKPITLRTAVAEASVAMEPLIREQILQGGPKGEALATARIAGIQAAKKTSELIPLCHGISPESVDVSITPLNNNLLVARATVTLNGRTGVEMEAMVAASITALTLYDMAKALDKSITIHNVRLLSKSGGKSGDWSS
jgi:cyclic pyranopterin phosphate synthase